MNDRKSKKMMHLKKKIYKITCMTTFIGMLAIMYAKNFQDEMIDDWMDQKYEYIAVYNNSVNGTYSVDAMRTRMAHTQNPVDQKRDNHQSDIPDFFKPQHHEAPPKDDQQEAKDPEQVKWEETFDRMKEDMMKFGNKSWDIIQKELQNQIKEIDDKFQSPEKTEQLIRHFQQHHGQHQPMRPRENDDDFDQHEETEHSTRKSQWKKQNPYKDWLDELPYMEKEEAASTVKSFMSCLVTACAIWGYVCYAIWQGFQLCLITKCMQAQKTLENKYMGPEIRRVRPTARQVAATTSATNERPQPVIQYIVEPQTAI